jgi:hypothetical protein
METTSLYNGRGIKSFRHFTKLRSEGVTMADIKQTASAAGTEVAAKGVPESYDFSKPFDPKEFAAWWTVHSMDIEGVSNEPVRMETEGEKKARYAREQQFYKASLEEDEQKYRDYCKKHPCVAAPCPG